MIIAALFIIAQIWKQPNVHEQSNNNRINKTTVSINRINKCGPFIQWYITQPYKRNEGGLAQDGRVEGQEHQNHN